ncbi:MAG: TolC family outer membrane protein [Gammaproteobacteria bacterium]|nr:TolC family outer membrane protein [Gammaproteobacteria bacterium]
MKRFCLRTVLTASLCVAGLPGIDQAEASDLWEIYELALANDPGFQAEVLAHEAAELNRPLDQSVFRPAVTSNAELGRQRSDATGTNRTSDDNQLSVQASLSIYDRPGRIKIAQTEIRIRASEYMLANARHDLMLRVAERYFNILAAQDAREVARLEKIAIRRQMDLADERLEVGLGTQTDFFDAKARFKQAEANEIQAQNLINSHVAALKEMIGVTPEALSPLGADAPLVLPVPDDIHAWVDKALAQNVPLRVQSLNSEIALIEMDRQKSMTRPTVSLGAEYRWQDSNVMSASPDDSTTTSVGLTVRYPLYHGGGIQLLTRQAGVLYNRENRLLEQARRLASSQTTSAFLDVTSSVSQVEALFEAIAAGESALEAKEEGFRAGLTTNLDVLDAQRDLSISRTNYLRARYNYILSVLHLERSAGQLDEEDIRRVNSWLD